MKNILILPVAACCLILSACGSPSSSSSKYTPADWHSRADSVPEPPMDGNALRAAFEQHKYEEAVHASADPEVLRKKLKKLNELRRNGSWVARYVKADSDNQDEIFAALGLSRQIHANYAKLQIQLEELDKSRGDAAMAKFRDLHVADVFDDRGQSVNRELLDELKVELFYSDRPPQIRSASGAGRYYSKLRPDLDPRTGYIGYVATLGKDFNLIMLKLDSGERIAVIYDKNVDSETYGPIAVF